LGCSRTRNAFCKVTGYGLLTVILCGTLLAGLNPGEFSFDNDVEWIGNGPGIRFGTYAIAFTEPIISAEQSDSFASSGFTFEVVLELPRIPSRGFQFIAAFHSGEDRSQLVIGQWRNHIIVMNGDDYDHKRRKPRLSVEIEESPRKWRLMTVTSSKDETAVYLDGRRIGSKADLLLRIPGERRKGRLLLGNSVYNKHSWAGAISRLALYSTVLHEDDINRHHLELQHAGDDVSVKSENPHLLYRFDETGGSIVRDHSDQHAHLSIPSKTVRLARRVFVSPLVDFNFSRSFVRDFVVNIIGFMPLGFVLMLTLRNFSGNARQSGIVYVVAIGFVVSFGIELLQSWMPSRSSAQLDLLLNTLGAYFGAVCFTLISHGESPSPASE
jgi:hypothetical protein